MLNNVRGNPISLFRFPGDFNVLYRWDNTEWVKSLVDVLPTLPVMPTTRVENRARHALAAVCSAFMVLSTNMQTGPSSVDGSSPRPISMVR